MAQKIIPLLLLAMALLFSSCEKLSELTTFNIDHTTSIKVASNTGVLKNVPITLKSPEIETSSEQAFENNNTRANLVDEVNMEKLDLVITAPSGQSFSFLNEIEIYINADGLEEILVASRYNIPDNIGSTLNLETSDKNLEEFIKKEHYFIRTKVLTDETLNQDVEIDVEMTFRVKAKLL